MRRLLRSPKIISPGSKHHLQSCDILIDNGFIIEIGDNIQAGDGTQVLDLNDHYISAGFCDMFADFADPGYEYKEDHLSGSRAALAGGFTAVALSPCTSPVCDNKAQVEYALQQHGPQIPKIMPLGAITIDTAGKDPSEMLDMFTAGAVAFSDGLKNVFDSGIMSRAFQYARLTNALVYSFPLDMTLSKGGMAAEGQTALSLGLKGIPALAEELVVQRDIELAAYNGARVHFTCITTAGSVEQIRRAKAKGINISCATSPFHLFFNDSAIATFDSRFKINPVLRTAQDVEALKAGVADGTVDAICSLHNPQNAELTDVEFEYAAGGAISLQTAFSMAYTALKDNMDITPICIALCYNPRRLLNKPAFVQEGQVANLTWFCLNDGFMLTRENNLSKSENSPVLDTPLQGCVKGVILNENIYCNE